MKKNLQNRLKAYSLLVGGAVMLPEQADAQTITYNNFADQQLDLATIPNNTTSELSLDVNSDGTTDIKFFGAAYTSSSAAGGSFYTSVATNKMSILVTNNAPDVIDAPTQICNTATNWGSYGTMVAGPINAFGGTWKNKDAYIGFRLDVGTTSNDFRYGWIRVQVQNSGKLTLKEAAYTDGTCIAAGATTSTGIMDNHVIADMVVFTNQSNEIVVRIPNGVVLDNKTVEIIDINGKVVYTGSFSGNETVLNADTYHHGLYMVRIISDNVLYSGKVVLK